ncbi:hypothetical protein EDWATA_03811 [Edwardsiella tarda ATCC 23685]|uniref:Uncharacterized protein n=1 Tax=Edwardsiella tarda ATCC 23685 TaxID=500638 RepID=D4FAJ2_EDWTA|nr:hypothetical protein EDWATA_03811 [Edwardsiella tarda ATCC 23685]
MTGREFNHFYVIPDFCDKLHRKNNPIWLVHRGCMLEIKKRRFIFRR